MADAVLFIGWGAVIPGRERQSFQVFSEGIAYWQRLQQEGVLESFEVVELEPHGAICSASRSCVASARNLNRCGTATSSCASTPGPYSW